MRAYDLVAAADCDLAAFVTDRAIDRLTELPAGVEQLSVYGYLHPEGALIAARRDDDRA